MASASSVRVLHGKSRLAVRPEFDFFTAPLTDASIAHTTYEAVSPSYPLSTDENQVISLFLPKDPVNFIDLSRSYLEIHIKGVGADAKRQFGSQPPVGASAETAARAIMRTVAPTLPLANTSSSKASASEGVADGELGTSKTTAKRALQPEDEYVENATDETLATGIKEMLGVNAWTVVNNIGASLFEIVKINVNEFNMFHSSHYPYQALLTKLLNVSRENLGSVQGLAYFTLEESNTMNGWSFGTNESLVDRAKAFHDGRTMTVYDRLYIPIAYARKLLPNNVSIRVELTQSKSAFSILAARNRTRWTGPNSTPAIKLQIANLTWHVCKVRPYDYLLDNINARLLKEPALYFFPRRDVRVFIIAAGSLSFHQIIFQGRKPQSITLAMVRDADALGNYFRTPFGFEAFGMQRCTLAVNNLLPTQPLEVDLDDSKWQSSYRMMADATGHNSEFGEGLLLTPQYYTDGNFLLHYPLTNNLSADAYLESAEVCNVNLSLEFKAGLNTAVRLIVLARFDDFVECMGAERMFVPSYALQ